MSSLFYSSFVFDVLFFPRFASRQRVGVQERDNNDGESSNSSKPLLVLHHDRLMIGLPYCS